MAAYFDQLTQHLLHVANIRWLHSVADDFFTKQLPFNVTWVLTLMYAVDQGQVANDPRAQVSALCTSLVCLLVRGLALGGSFVWSALILEHVIDSGWLPSSNKQLSWQVLCMLCQSVGYCILYAW